MICQKKKKKKKCIILILLTKTILKFICKSVNTQIHKHYIKIKFRLSDSGSDSDSDLKSSDSGSELSGSGLGNFFYSVFSQLYLEMHFLREQFKYVLTVWLLISLAAALYFHGC